MHEEDLQCMFRVLKGLGSRLSVFLFGLEGSVFGFVFRVRGTSQPKLTSWAEPVHVTGSTFTPLYHLKEFL